MQYKPIQGQPLLSADQIQFSRRDLKEKRDLDRLKNLMSFAEWSKLTSAKQRKKRRKMAAREETERRLQEALAEEANAEEQKVLLPPLSLNPSPYQLSIAREQRFEEETAGRGMVLSDGGLVVRKVPGASTATYVFWGDPRAAYPLSRWTIRIDKKRSAFYIGVASLPLDPPEGFAKYLQSHAIMLSDSGNVFMTQPGTPRNPLLDKIVPVPDGGKKVRVEIPLLGTATFAAKNKYRKHRFAFKDGSIVQMELDRTHSTVRFCVDKKQWITLEEVPPGARPFLNFFTPGDGASLLAAEDGKTIPEELQ